MSLKLVSRKAAKRHFDPERSRRINVVQMKRQWTLSNDLLSWFAPKRYPCIFLDQRLRSRFFK